MQKRIPKLCRHKATGQAVVRLNGRDIYLGKHGTKASKDAYDRLIAEWLATGRTCAEDADELTIAELLAAYMRHAKRYYAGSNEAEQIKYAMRPLKALYADTPVREFGPLKLKAVRQRMIDAGLSRSGINKRIGRIKRIFKWGVANELCPRDMHHALRDVDGLTRGRTEAKETEPVRPAPEAFIEAVKPHVRPQVWAMIELQRLTGMRPGEVTVMRSCDLDTSGAVWLYRPAQHKNTHRGHERTIYLGPKAQAVLKPWLKTDLQAYLFSPAEAVAMQRAERARNRKTPRSQGNTPGSNRRRNPKKQPGDRYTVAAYRKAIKAACLKADVPTWTPHRLRHSAAAQLERDFGYAITRTILGHRSLDATKIYAPGDAERAMQVIAKIG